MVPAVTQGMNSGCGGHYLEWERVRLVRTGWYRDGKPERRQRNNDPQQVGV
jgi:hypothetical protein